MGPGETNEQLGKGEGAAQKVDPPTITIASGDESTMNASGEVGFPAPTRCELRRIPLPRASVNRPSQDTVGYFEWHDRGG